MTALGEAVSEDERVAEAAIRAVPGWANATIAYRRAVLPVMSPTHRAVDSDCWAIDVDGAPFFLKIVHPEMRDAIDVAASFTAARMAAAAGVAPALLHYLLDHHAAVFARLDEPWRTARMDDLRRPDVMACLLAAKRRVHALTPFDRPWSVFDAVRALPDPLENVPDLWWMRDALDDIEVAMTSAGVDAKPCHADGLASNVMIGPGGAVRLVDWDNACDTDPLYDVAVLLNETCVLEEEMLPALEAFEGRVRPGTLARCRLYAVADDLHWGLWAYRMDAISARRDVEFLKYANWRLLRCRLALHDPGYERWLRTL